MNLDYIVASLGETNLAKTKFGERAWQQHPKRIMIHKKYDDDTLEYDISLVQIVPVRFSPNVKPIPLPKSDVCRMRQKRRKKRKENGEKSQKRKKRSKGKFDPWLRGEISMVTG